MTSHFTPSDKLRPKRMHPNGELLSITINTNDANQYYSWQTYVRAKNCIRTYYNIVQILKHVADITLYPEISKAGRYHMHGTILLNDSFEFYSHVIPLLKAVCNMDIDTIQDPEYWYQYCTKDRYIMESGLEAYGLPYEINNKTLIKRWNTKTIQLKVRINKEIYKEQEEKKTSILQFIEQIKEELDSEHGSIEASDSDAG